MICIEHAIYEEVMQALRNAGTNECDTAARTLLTASAQSFLREIRSERPVLCRAQAG